VATVRIVGVGDLLSVASAAPISAGAAVVLASALVKIVVTTVAGFDLIADRLGSAAGATFPNKVDEAALVTVPANI
jgi:hypothetical protein